MYEPETILALKEPRSTDEEPFPYDKVKVVGQSPIHHGVRSEEWVGQNGQGVIVQPVNGFGSTLDEPFGKLQELYSVEALPEPPEVGPPVKVITQAELGPSPEDVFAEEAAKTGESGRRTKKSPPRKSPLDGEVIEEAAEE